jgi:hypothetical protein
MHFLFLAFVVIVVLLRLGFGPTMANVVGALAKAGFAIACIIAVIALAIWGANQPAPQTWRMSQAAPAQTSNSDCETPAQTAARQAAAERAVAKTGSYQDALNLADPYCVTDDTQPPPAQAERSTDPYEKSLQILAGEKLKPLN